MAKHSILDFLFTKSLKGRNEIPQIQSKPKRRWRLLQVEPAIACNLHCVMCPWREIAKNSQHQGLMRQSVWDALRPNLPQTRSIDFTGSGEPLMQPKLAEWIAEAKGAGCQTGFLTNGLLLKRDRLAQLLEAGLDWICISMDGATAEIYEKIRIGANFERVCEHVLNIAALRADKVPKTMINFVLMDANFHQVEKIVELAAELGVDQVNFKQCDVIRGNAGKGLGLFSSEDSRAIRRLRKSVAKARRRAHKLSVLTTAFAFTPQERPVCEQDPRGSLFIRYDGTVAPCINLAYGGATTFLGKDVDMASVHYGRLPEDDLLDLWNSDSCKFYRQQFEHRLEKHEQILINRLMGNSGSNRQRTLQAALDAMPEPPQGCNVCHYLYDI